MEKKRILVDCVNDGCSHEVSMGQAIGTIAMPGAIAALVDNRLQDLDFLVYAPCKVEFVDSGHPDGRRTYIRSLCFVLQKAVRELFPSYTLIIDYCLPSGLYCELRQTAPSPAEGVSGGVALDGKGRPIIKALGEKDLQNIRAKMQDIIARNLRFSKVKMTAAEAIALFQANDQPDKARLVHSLGKYNFSVNFLTDENEQKDADTFYGPLAPTTGHLGGFAIAGFKEGFVLQYPMVGASGKIEPMKKQAKIASTLKAHSDWCSIMGVKGIGSLNHTILNGGAVNLINLAEVWQEEQYGEVARKIYAQRDKVKIIFIAGPSSSGKTSSSLRLNLHLKVLGMRPKVVELDNYFVDREFTPRDAQGEYDFECLEAMDLKLLNQHLNALLAGEEVEIPKYNFKTGHRDPGKLLKLEEKDILIMEGIHALNPAMVSDVDNSRIFRIYASALTSLSIDENNNISTSDNRLLRRIVRDNRVRGVTPEGTIMRWNSVRRGENRNIFPFQENADAEFNSALIFELPLLKYYAEPLLRRISPDSPAYGETLRLLNFLKYIVPLSPDEIAAIPPTSIMREFIGGQTL